MYAGSLLVAVLACAVGAAFVAALYGVVALLAPKNPYPLKDAVYECGHEPVGTPRVPFRVQYYGVGIVFLIFDIETAFLYPWGLVFREIGWTAYFEMVLFVAILLIGLLYAWRKGVLTWA